MRQYSVVELLVDLPEEGLSAGMIGTVVAAYADPPGYEVEFVDQDGGTIALLALAANQLRPVDRR